MKLVEAVQLSRQVPQLPQGRFRLQLVCGFMPLHLQTFLHAYLRRAFPLRHLEVATGLFGDVAGNLERALSAPADALALVVEWADLDPRLGLRRLGGWSVSKQSEIVETAGGALERLLELLRRADRKTPLALCAPTLPLPPMSHTPGWQASPFQSRLRERVASFCAEAASLPLLRLVDEQELALASPLAQRLDVRGDLHSGFPYSNAHADKLAEIVACLLHPPEPKKGLITDLDDTLWRGILGEAGVEGISWDLEHGSQIHGLYQQLLASLGEGGALLAVASKNDPHLVEEAFRRGDLLLPREAIFPLEAGWGRKSEAVLRILKAWNIGAHSVVFIDDSPMELAEVQASFPEVDCRLFPRKDADAAYGLLKQLRDSFGKSALSEEDSLRRESLRQGAVFRAERVAAAGADDFLPRLQSEITLDYRKDPRDQRPLDLLNKTNQFNLNGRRYTEADWQTYLDSDDTFVQVASYADKFGPLGKIAVISGRARNGCLEIDSWVMSCRAFSRRIEHCCLQQLFERFGIEKARFDFAATARNGPLREFLEEVLQTPPQPGLEIVKSDFLSRRPAWFHQVKEVVS